MKIFHCLRNYFPDPVGGTEIYVAALCKELQVLGIEVAVVKPTFNQEPKYYFYEGVQVLEYLETSRPEEVLHGLYLQKDSITLRILQGNKNLILYIFTSLPEVME